MAGPYRNFLKDLADHLTKNDVEVIKFLLSEYLPAGIAENLTNALDLLNALHRQNYISYNNVAPLRDLFDDIPRRDLFWKIDDYNNSVREIVDIPVDDEYKVKMPEESENFDETYPSESPVDERPNISPNPTVPDDSRIFPAPNQQPKPNSIPLRTPDYFRQKTSSSAATNSPMPSVNGASSASMPFANGASSASMPITNGAPSASMPFTNSASSASMPPLNGGSARSMPSMNDSTDLPENRQPRPSTHARPEAYSMNKEPRGLAVIYSNRFDQQVISEHKSRLCSRPGTEKDVEELTSTFKYLKFDVRVERNLTAKNIELSLKSLAADQKQEQNDCFVVCILSHGYEGGIYGNDGCALDVRSIREIYLADKCPYLLNKPKLFFIQACQGEADKRFVNVQPDSGLSLTQFTEDQLTPNANQATTSYTGEEKVPIDADFMFFMATTPGTVSWRDTIHGSWFIQTLCKVFKDYSSSWSLMEMVIEVNKKMSQKSAEVDGIPVVQISSLDGATLRKNLYF